MTMKTSSKSALIGFFAGVMVAVAPSCGGNAVCDASTCASGCCDGDGTCQPGTATAACGTGARACVACLASQACGLGTCSTINTGTGGGSTTGGGGGATGGGSATGGGGGGVNDSPIVVNEIASSDGDFFELFNTGTTAVDLSGYVVADLDSATGGPKTSDGLTLPSGTSLAAGGFLLFTEGTDAGVSTDCLGPTVSSCFNVTFGLSAGNGDAVFLINPAGTVVASSTIGPSAHGANLSVGRIPDGTGTFVETARTPGFANALAVAVDAGPTIDAGTDAGADAGSDLDAGAPVDGGTTEVVFNEVGLNQGDFVELKNVGAGTADLSGWMLADLATDGGPKVSEGHLFPANTTIAAGAYLLNIESATGCADAGPGPCQTFAFGLSLGSGDAVFLINPAGATVLRLDIPPNSHASGRSYGRLPDGTGSFADTARTLGATNQP